MLSNALSSMPKSLHTGKFCLRRCVKTKTKVNDSLGEDQNPVTTSQKKYLFFCQAFTSSGLYLAALLYAFLGGLIFTALEPDRFDTVAGFYFCVVSLTLIGYGDIAPSNPSVKIFWIF